MFWLVSEVHSSCTAYLKADLFPIKDLFSFFLHLKNKYEDDNEIALVLENYEITKLDVNRIYRYLDKFTNENVSESDEVNSDIDD